MSLDRYFTPIARAVERAVGHPFATILALVSIVVWIATGPLFNYSDSWQMVINTGTTIITFLMVFLIQNCQSRDTAAIHIKLDELLRAISSARTELVVAEDLEQEELDDIKADLHQVARDEANRI